MTGDFRQVSCPRCGAYEITGSARAMLRSRLSDERTQARLSHAIRRRASVSHWPRIDSNNLDDLIAEKLPKSEQARINLLRWIAQRADDDHFGPIEMPDDEELAGVAGVLNGERVYDLFAEMAKLDLVRPHPDSSYALTSKAWENIEQAKTDEQEQPMPGAKNRIFIGHGGSPLWRDLKDLIVDRLKLEHEEFDREPAAGLSISARLQQMLDSASFAFLVMTAEDERPDGTMAARLNVVHEVGLFQGRLGFQKAIILLEEGCEEFSNIHGLVQIRFPRGNVKAVSEQIRHVLEREGIIGGPETATRPARNPR